jgi:hypothetical protein
MEFDIKKSIGLGSRPLGMGFGVIALWIQSMVPCAGETLTVLEVAKSLEDPVVLELKSGRTIQGDLRRVEDERLVISGRLESGGVEYSFTKEEIRKLEFPGDELISVIENLIEDDRCDNAIHLIDQIYRQRGRYFGFMKEGQLADFQKLAELAYRAGDYYLAVGVARNVQPYVDDLRVRRQLDDLVLLGHYHLPLKADTRQLAEAWVAEWERYAESALGWYVLGQMALDDGRVGEALDYALCPIVFSSQFRMDYLEYCYALAIVAALRLEDARQAEVLLDEMKARGLLWPDDPTLSSYRWYYDAG